MIGMEGVFGARLTGVGFGGACVALVKEGRAAEIGKALTSTTFDPGHLRKVIVPPPMEGTRRGRTRR